MRQREDGRVLWRVNAELMEEIADGVRDPFSGLPVPALLRVVCNQVVNQQLNRIERLRAAAVQPEREDLADYPLACGPFPHR